MKKRIIITLSVAFVFTFALLGFSRTIVYAAIKVGQPLITTSLGNVDTLNSFAYWLINLFKYLGWAMAITGVFITLVLLIYNLISADDTETMKKIHASIIKLLVIIGLGVLLLSASFMLHTFGNLTDKDVTVDLNKIGN